MTTKASSLAGRLVLWLLYSSLRFAQAQPVITNQPASQLAAVGSSVSFSVGVTDTNPVTYTWQLNGTNLPGAILTVAGGGTGALGDNGKATNAFITNAYAIAVDSAGTLYIADTGNNRIRKVTNGIISTIAGNGNPSYSGDKGAATSAALNNPSGVAVDGAGQVYIADTRNNRIRKIDTNGIITTIIGTGTAGYNGDGFAPASTEISSPMGLALDIATNIYFIDLGNQRVRRTFAGSVYTIEGTGTAGSADTGYTPVQLHNPTGVAVDFMGDVIIADWLNGRVIATSNSMTIDVAGKGGGGFAGDGGPGPQATLLAARGVAVDFNLNIYIADTGNNRIRMVGPNSIITNKSPIAPTTYSTFLSGTISTYAGNGAAGFGGDGYIATGASLNFPYAVAVDSKGDLFISDMGNGRIREVLPYQLSPTLTLSNLTFTNAGNYTVVVSDSTGSVTSSVAALTVGLPPAITSTPTNQYVLAGGSISLSVGATGTGPLYYEWFQDGTNLVEAGLSSTLTLTNATLDESGSYSVVVTNSFSSAEGLVSLLTVGVPPTIVTQTISSLVLPGSNANLSVTVSGTGPFTYTWQLNGTNLPNNIIGTIAGQGTNFYPNGVPSTNAIIYCTGLCSDLAGNVYLADQNSRSVLRIDSSGLIWNFAGNINSPNPPGGFQATNTAFPSVESVGADLFGNIYIGGLGKLWKVAPNGIVSTVAGTTKAGFSGDGGAASSAQVSLITGIACDPVGNVYISDETNNRVRMINAAGIINTILGDGGSFGAFGTNNAGTNFGITSPQGLALDSIGNAYVATENYVIKLATNGLASSAAGNGGVGFAGDGGRATNALLFVPFGVAFDAIGNLYMSEYMGSRIRIVGTNGIIQTAAGSTNGVANYSGDGGPATAARLSQPRSICTDPFGNLFIADQQSRYLREIFYSGLPSLTITNASASAAGNYTVVISSPFGSVTSSIVPLELAVAPSISQITVQSNGWRTISFTGTPTAQHQLLFTTNLAPPVAWVPVATNSADLNGNGTLTDTNAPEDDGFYEVMLPISP